jgi:hypothetical protein
MTNPNDPITTIISESMGCTITEGLTKREAFSMAAITGLLANPDLSRLISNWPMHISATAVEAVKIADALINALNAES